jgi:hypothetical protein
MKLLTVATVAVFAFAIPQIPQVLAQNPDKQSGASVNQGKADEAHSSGNASTRSNARGKSLGGNPARPGSSAGGGAEKSQARVGISAKSREATVRGRSSTRIGVNSESRENVTIRHKRARGVALLKGETERDIVIKRKRAHRAAALSYEPRRHIVVKRRHPGVAVTTGETTRTTVKSRMGSNTNVRAGVRSRETTGSSTMIHRGQSGSSSRLSRSPSGSHSGGQSRGGGTGTQSGGNAGSTTGQGNR